MVTISEETKKKITETYYRKAIVKAESEIGKIYNNLTITGIDYDRTKDSYYNKPYNAVYVFTKCKCGNESKDSVQLRSVKSGHTQSCGCIKFNNPLVVEDLTGQKFGRLTVLGRDLDKDKLLHDSGNKGVHWLCKCDCGNPKLSSVTGYQLKSGHTQSCGCYASEQIAKRNKKYSTKTNRTEVNGDNTITLFDDDDNKCLIDFEDYDVVKRWYWRKSKKRGRIDKGYWLTNVKEDDEYDKTILSIHQVIAKIKFGEYSLDKIPDHLSRDTDDNRKCNIVLKSNQENSHNRGLSKTNSSGKTGVSFNKQKNLWTAYITVNYKTIHLGDFKNFAEAVKNRKEAEEKYGFTCDENVAAYDEGGKRVS